MKIIIRIIINAIALWLTALIIGPINLSDDILSILIVAVIFGLINAFIRPIIKILTLPLTILTLGLFTLVINALMLWLTSVISDALSIEGSAGEVFLYALIGSIIISIISTILSSILTDD